MAFEQRLGRGAQRTDTPAPALDPPAKLADGAEPTRHRHRKAVGIDQRRIARGRAVTGSPRSRRTLTGPENRFFCRPPMRTDTLLVKNDAKTQFPEEYFQHKQNDNSIETNVKNDNDKGSICMGTVRRL
jgi:hypothetical protein